MVSCIAREHSLVLSCVPGWTIRAGSNTSKVFSEAIGCNLSPMMLDGWLVDI